MESILLSCSLARQPGLIVIARSLSTIVDSIRQGGGVRLAALPCEQARGQKWSHDPETQELVWESADSVKCAAVHSAPSHGPKPDPESAGVPETWAKPLPGKGAAIAFLNRAANPAAFNLKLSGA